MKWIANNKEKIVTISFCFFTSFLILALTSKCSFLYPFNDWVDANAFFTVGKSMVKGIVPYLEVFEQKGLLLYLIYGIGYLICHTTFLGVFILEILFGTVFLYYCHKIVVLYLDKKWSYFILPLFMMFLCTSESFVHGGSAEEFSLPFFAISLYYFLDFFKTETISNKRLLIAGLCAGGILLIKYTLLGFWFALMASIFFYKLAKKEYKKAITSCFIFLGGMLLPFGIACLYMGINGGLREFFHVYFTLNMTVYGNMAAPLLERIIQLFQGFWDTTYQCGRLETILLLGMPIFLLKIDMNKKGKLAILFLYLFTILGIYWGLKFYRYYLFPITIFELVSLIGILSWAQKYVPINRVKGIIIVSFLLSILSSFQNANYREFRFQKKEDMFQYEFAKEINKYENPTLVNMGYLDCGVYTAADLLPSTYFFERQNFSYQKFPDNIDSFQKYIREKETLFIVYYTKLDLETLRLREPTLFENYELIMQRKQRFENSDFYGYLYRRKEV